MKKYSWFVLLLCALPLWSGNTDIDGDGDVDRADILLLFANFPELGPDLDGDGFTTILDGVLVVPDCQRLACTTEDDPLRVIFTSHTPGTTLDDTTVTLAGTVDRTLTSLTINGSAAVVSGFGFTLAGFPLEPGRNTILATALDGDGNAGTGALTLYRDTTPPIVAIDSPADGARLATATIDVAGFVTDLMPTLDSGSLSVTVNGQAADVVNGSFAAADISLTEGGNTLTVTATDAFGNMGNSSITVTRESNLAGLRIEPITSRMQRADPRGDGNQLTIRVTDDGVPVANRTVTFAVVSGNGQVGDGDGVRRLTLLTDGSGEAAVPFNAGSRAGEGNHRVRVTSPGVISYSEFLISRDAGPAAALSPVQISQRAAVGNQTPLPLAVLATDSAGNPVLNASVTFSVIAGGGEIQGSSSTTVLTGVDGIASAPLIVGRTAGNDSNQVRAALDNGGRCLRGLRRHHHYTRPG